MRFLRMLAGYLLASIGAAMVLGMFAFAPPSFDQFMDRIGEVAENAWSVIWYLAGAIAFFGAVPAIIALLYAEHHKIRTWLYYELVGAAVAVLAYWLAHGTELTPARGEGNLYSTIAFLVSGAVLGLLYWLFAGRYAGQDHALVPPAGGIRPGPTPAPKAQTAVGAANNKPRAATR